MDAQADIGLIGLAVMGQNLVLNMNDHGFTVAVFNRTVAKVDEFLGREAKGTKVIGAHSLPELAALLKRPRRVMFMVKAGQPVDDLIEEILPHLEKGDIIIDGGNSLFQDTNRRTKYLESKGLMFIGTGVSGGEEGARNGPSIMPGGSKEAWPHVKDIFQSIAAKVEDGTPCCDWVGENGAGHYVKMVHNGIEYGDMELICEAYQLMKEGLGMTAAEMQQDFVNWNKTELDSYLIEITSHILAYKDTDGQPLVDKILDAAGQKGTGKWTVINSTDLGIPITLIAEAVYSRCVSALKEERVAAAKKLKGPRPKISGDRAAFVEAIRLALYASKIISYAQGYMLMRAAAKEYGWNLNYGGVALMWRGGCIIRSRFLGKIKEAYDKTPHLTNLLLDNFFRGEIKKCQKGWRTVVAMAARKGIPTPAFSTALSFYDSYRCARLPANLLQAQRDYFGAHTYERIDQPRGQFFHTNWTGHGGVTSSGAYTVEPRMTPADPAQALRDFEPQKKFFVGIDSDGCVFDTMEIKHKECFAPAFIRHFHLQAASKHARQTWEFVNLYSQSRGCNRFPALALSLGLLRRRPEVLARQVAIFDTQPLEQWIARAGKLSEGALAAEIKAGRAELTPLLDWSKAVNAAIADIVLGVPPFPLVREVLEKLAPQADAMVISQTPGEALRREWAEHGLGKHVRLIAGQEMGSKSEHLQLAAAGKYPRENILMIGDAPGDYKAAKANNVLFFPIVSNREEESWKELYTEGLDRFFAGKFAGEYEKRKFAEFDASLPGSPPWKEVAG